MNYVIINQLKALRFKIVIWLLTIYPSMKPILVIIVENIRKKEAGGPNSWIGMLQVFLQSLNNSNPKKFVMRSLPFLREQGQSATVSMKGKRLFLYVKQNPFIVIFFVNVNEFLPIEKKKNVHAEGKPVMMAS